MTVLFFAVVAAVATATNYVLQPELSLVANDLNSTVPAVGAAAAAALVGYLLGLALLVPLVDRIKANVLIAVELIALSGGLLVAATSHGVVQLAWGFLAIGACAACGAQMSTLAAKLAGDGRRGRAVGAVTAGISAGILVGRLAGGALTDAVGWRAMLMVFGGIALLLAGVTAAVLRRSSDVMATAGYLSTIRTLPRLLATERLLRRSAVAGALWFCSFSLVWTGLAVALALPPLHLSPQAVGLFALSGALGVFVTPFAGRWADTVGSRRVILGGLTTAFVCIVAMTFALHFLTVLAILLAFFDAGLFTAQVGNQSRVFGIDVKQPARFNSAYMVVYFVGGSIGTGAAAACVTFAGWQFVLVLAAIAILAAAGSARVFHVKHARQPGQAPERDHESVFHVKRRAIARSIRRP
ncbi:MAG TPA: MFS transporter [Pseudonocardia sp.]